MQKKIKVSIIIAILLTASTSAAMGDKSKDSDCVKDSNVKLRVDDVTFSVPRKQVTNITYSTESPYYMPSTSARDLCQKPGSEATAVEGFTLSIRPKEQQFIKEKNYNCMGSPLGISIGKNQRNALFQDFPGQVFPKKISLEQLRKQCEKTRNYDACQGGYLYRSLNMSFHYYQTCYPHSEWQKTIKSINDYLDQSILKE